MVAFVIFSSHCHHSDNLDLHILFYVCYRCFILSCLYYRWMTTSAAAPSTNLTDRIPNPVWPVGRALRLPDPPPLRQPWCSFMNVETTSRWSVGTKRCTYITKRSIIISENILYKGWSWQWLMEKCKGFYGGWVCVCGWRKVLLVGQKQI